MIQDSSPPPGGEIGMISDPQRRKTLRLPPKGRSEAGMGGRGDRLRVSVSPRLRVEVRGLLTPGAWLLALGCFALVVLFAYLTVTQASTLVTIMVDGRAELVETRRADVRALLADLGLNLRPEDRVSPSPETRLGPGMTVTLQRARPCLITTDGTLLEIFTHATTVGGALREAGVQLSARDEIWMDGGQVGITTTLPPPSAGSGDVPATYARPRSWMGQAPAPVRLSLRRAVPITVDEGSVPYTIFTTAPTIGEALLREGLVLYLGDIVHPGLGEPARAGLNVMIKRSKPFVVTVDGSTLHTRSGRDTLGDALVELGIVVSGADRTVPSLTEPLTDNMEVRVVRVLETVQVKSQVIPYEALMTPDDKLELDRQRLAQEGKNGEYRWRFKVVYEDGVEASRSLLDEWLAAEPLPRIVSYGRKIVSRPLETPDGTLSYWRKITMYATAYSAATSGTPRSAPWYGRTRIGLKLTRGLVAVDPKVIPLGTRVYVPGYGMGLAADIGGGVRGRMIDLGYDDWNLQSWHWWVDVFVLDPPPPPGTTTWVLPKYPEGRFPMRRS